MCRSKSFNFLIELRKRRIGTCHDHPSRQFMETKFLNMVGSSRARQRRKMAKEKSRNRSQNGGATIELSKQSAWTRRKKFNWTALNVYIKNLYHDEVLWFFSRCGTSLQTGIECKLAVAKISIIKWKHVANLLVCVLAWKYKGNRLLQTLNPQECAISLVPSE